MKITSIDLYSNKLKAASFSFRDPSATRPYIVDAMTGLDADEIVPKFYGVAVNRHHSLTQLKRTVVLRITLNPNFSIGKTPSELRDDLYRTISSSRTGKVELRFNNGSTPVAGFSGFISKFESPMFNKTSQVQITIDSDEGMLYGLSSYVVNPLKLGALDEEFTIVDDVSTAPHGFSFEMVFSANSSNFFMSEIGGDGSNSFEVIPGTVGGLSGFQAGDTLYFSSNEGFKEFFIIRGMGNVYSLIDKIDIYNNTWPIMFPGPNSYVIGSAGAYTWNKFYYTPVFWGV